MALEQQPRSTSVRSGDSDKQRAFQPAQFQVARRRQWRPTSTAPPIPSTFGMSPPWRQRRRSAAAYSPRNNRARLSMRNLLMPPPDPDIVGATQVEVALGLAVSGELKVRTALALSSRRMNCRMRVLTQLLHRPLVNETLTAGDGRNLQETAVIQANLLQRESDAAEVPASRRHARNLRHVEPARLNRLCSPRSGIITQTNLLGHRV